MLDRSPRRSSRRHPHRHGFTIVELLIVIVIIGILAAITIVSFNGVSQRATAASLSSDLTNAAKQLKIDQVTLGQFPATLAAANSGAGVKTSNGAVFQYTFSAALPQAFCITATKGTVSYYIDQSGTATSGTCPGYVVGGGGPANTFTSITWSLQASPGTTTWSALASSADGVKLVAGASNGTLYTSADSGVTWTQRTIAGTHSWSIIASSSDGTKLVAYDNTYGTNTIYVSTDSGVTWTKRTSLYSNLYWQALTLSADGSQLVAADGYDTDAGNGYVYTSSDLGLTWSIRLSMPQGSTTNIATSADGTKMVAVQGQPGYIYVSTNSGVTWTSRTSAGSRAWQNVSSSADGTKLAASVAGSLYVSTDSGATWTARTSPGAEFVASSADGSKLITAMNFGYFSTSTDGGVTWTQQTSFGTGAWRQMAVSSDGSRLLVIRAAGAGVANLYIGVYQ